jgi:hypothetical protein
LTSHRQWNSNFNTPNSSHHNKDTSTDYFHNNSSRAYLANHCNNQWRNRYGNHNSRPHNNINTSSCASIAARTLFIASAPVVTEFIFNNLALLA